MTDNEALARAAGFSDMMMDREDYQSEPSQHHRFADDCALVIAAILIVASFIGLAWCVYLFPSHTACIAALIGLGMCGFWVFSTTERNP